MQDSVNSLLRVIVALAAAGADASIPAFPGAEGYGSHTPGGRGGWPVYASAAAPADSDHDGMPDAWEKARGLNPRSAADGPKDADGDGYTNVEEFLNGTGPATVAATWGSVCGKNSHGAHEEHRGLLFSGSPRVCSPWTP